MNSPGYMRGLIPAFQFLTRLPLPHAGDDKREDSHASMVWFPFVGLVIGILLAAAAWCGLHINHWIAALLVMLVWVGVTGALHLDGLADLADALGAAHRHPERFYDVLKDPHIGAFGVIALFCVLISKLVAVSTMFESPALASGMLILIPAWARFGAILWSRTLPAIAPGMGEKFAQQGGVYAIWLWGLVLFAASWMLAGLLFAMSCVMWLWLWRAYLQWRLHGMTGDCLGAGIEVCESCMLLLGLCF